MKSFSFENPWLLLITLPLIILSVIPFLRLHKKRRTKKHIASLVMRSLAILLILAMLAGMSSITSSDDVSIIILADLSDSTAAEKSDMAAFVEEIIDNANGSTEIGLVVFADGCIYELELGSEVDFSGFTSAPAASATDIEGALRYASSLLSTDTCERIILLSDGEQTEGDAEAAAVELAYQQIRIDSVLFGEDGSYANEVQINDVNIPSDTYAGEAFDITVTAQSTSDTLGTLFLYDNGALSAQIEISLSEGVNTYTIEAVAASSGVHTFMAQLSVDGDSISENNTYYSYIKVLGNPNILIIEGTQNESAALSSLLQDEYDITAVLEANAPSTLAELYNYDEVILMNVSAADLPEGFDTVLEEYISVLGRGVFTTGGTGTYYYGAMSGTAFDDFLPVALDVNDEDNTGGSTALIILLDSSSSMTGTAFELAQEGAINCVNTLSDTDYIGIIAFADKSYVLSELTSATNRDSVNDAISAFSTVRGTYLCAAVKEAYSQLKDSDADTKHVIIISDGNPNDSGYDAVVEDMYASGITTSTILIGDGTSTQGGGYNMGSVSTSAIMQELAELGGGEFYQVQNVEDLPDIMVEETEQHLTSYINEGTFTPEINTISQVLSGIDSIPTLDGYITTKLKSAASSVLYTDSNKPVFAEWDYGNGHVSTFTSDLSGIWSATFMSSQEGITFIKNVVSSLLPSESELAGLDVEITQEGTETTLSVEALNYSDESQVTASIISPEGNEYNLVLNSVSEGVYTNSIDKSEEGVYTVFITQSDGTGSVTAYTNTAFAASYSAEYDAFITGGEELLESISSITDGKVMSDADDLMSIDIEPIETESNLFLPLGILAAILLISDLIMRNAKWKDILKFFGKK